MSGVDDRRSARQITPMTIRPIFTVPSPVLKQISEPVAIVDDEIRTLIEDMFDSMYDAVGIGLAAVQIGVPLRVIVMDLARESEPRAPRHFINPEILERSEEFFTYQEGCLSVPEIYDDVERPARVKLRYLNNQGDEIIEWAEGLYAVCIQHEMDHLEGVLFLDHLSKLKRDRAVQKVKKATRGGKNR